MFRTSNVTPDGKHVSKRPPPAFPVAIKPGFQPLFSIMWPRPHEAGILNSGSQAAPYYRTAVLLAYLKLAWTLVSAVMVTLQVGVVPEQEPVHPVKFSPAAGAAVNVTVVPCWNFAEQLLPQLIDVPNSPFG